MLPVSRVPVEARDFSAEGKIERGVRRSNPDLSAKSEVVDFADILGQEFVDLAPAAGVHILATDRDRGGERAQFTEFPVFYRGTVRTAVLPERILVGVARREAR